MSRPRLQFSLAALLLTIAAVANVLWLIVEAPPDLARIVSVVGIVVLSALSIIGVISGQATLRAFCIGAIVPLAMMLFFIATNLGGLINVLADQDRLNPFTNPSYGTSPIELSVAPRVFGVGILLSIALGFLCVGMHWLCSERARSETAGPGGRLQPADSRVPRRRRWLQFSLRTLFVLTTGLAIWLGFVVKGVREQREAVKAIEALGGVVQYDWEEADFDPNSRTLLRRIVGDDYFQEASHVAFEKWPPPSDVALVRLIPYLQRFQRLQFLTVPQSVSVQMEAALHCDVLTVVPPGPANPGRLSQESPEK